MRIPRIGRLTQPADAIPPHATGAPRRREPSAPLYGMRPADDYRPFRLPAENPNLLVAYPGADMFGPGAEQPARAAGPDRGRPACRILTTSRTAEFRAAVAAADRLGYETAVAENLLLLDPDDSTAAGYLAVLSDAAAVITDRPQTPAVTR